MSAVEQKFKKAVEIINAKPGPNTPKVKVDMKQKLAFYGLFKQATEGKCNVKAPSKTDIANYYKWKAWTTCGDMSKEEAMKKYVELATSVMPANLKAKL